MTHGAKLKLEVGILIWVSFSFTCYYIYRLICNPCLHMWMINYSGPIDVNLDY